MSYLIEGLRRGFLGAMMASFASYTMLVVSTLGHTTVSLDAPMLTQHYVFYLLSGLYLAGISVLFNIEEWSLLRQVVTHVICTLPFLPIGYMVGIMPRNLMGMSVFGGMYLSGYVVSYVLYKAHLKKEAELINEAL